MIETIRRLRPILEPAERRQAGSLLAMMLGGALLEVVSVGAIPLLLALVAAPERLLRMPVVRHAWEGIGSPSPGAMLPWVAGAVLLLFLAKNSYLAFVGYARARFAYGLQVTLSSRLFDTYMRSPYTFHLERDTARLLRNVNAEVQQLISGILLPCLALVLEGLTAGLICAVLLWVQPIASLGAAVLLGGTTWLFLRAVRSRLTSWGRLQQEARGRMTHAVQQGLWGVRDAQLLGREDHFVRVFRAAASDFAKTAELRQVVAELPNRILETVAVTGLLCIGAFLLVQGVPTTAAVPILALFAAAAYRLLPACNRVASSVSIMRFSRPALDVVAVDLGRWRRIPGPVPPAVGHPATRHRLPFDRAIEVKNVQFTYPGSRAPALRGVSLEIPRGSAVAFVGPSGAGKTTLADLILGLLAPSDGAVFVDGRDTREDLRAWQRCLGYVSQTIFLADDSIRRNVAFGLADAEIDDEMIWRSLEAAQLASFVLDLPNGLATPIGERGVCLSGGQRQRMAIARALYYDPQVLVLDEATSSLDVEMECEVVRAIEKLRGDRTLIIIAHRLQTVRNCNVLYLVDNGRIASSGPYEELREASAPFRAMTAATLA